MELTNKEIYNIISTYIREGLADDKSALAEALKQANGKEIEVEFIF